ncbi:hypothetical protein D9M71_814940 [compost metagenome]
MVTSIEPGVYLPNELGIRIENLYEVVEVEAHPGFLGFQVLTLVPFAIELIEHGLLSQAEAQWLDEYHRTVRGALAPSLEPDVAAWLKRQTLPNNMQFRAE